VEISENHKKNATHHHALIIHTLTEVLLWKTTKSISEKS